MPWRPCSIALLLLASLVPAAGADHPQAGGEGETIAFDHKGGNEWWVEVRVALATSEPESIHVDRVEARDDGGEWKVLTLRSWGNWAASFHIEPGHRVQFRAFQHGGMSDVRTWESCWFTHPAGAEQCETQPGAFNATFSNVRGNEWWVETDVAVTGGALAGDSTWCSTSASSAGACGVDAQVNGGGWFPLEATDWGSWARSTNVREGWVVQFRARSTDAEEVRSGCYRWTAATPADCPPDVISPPFDAVFSDVKGNAWWIEAKVVGNQEVRAVDVSLNVGAWKPLTLRSWGAWAASYPAPEGTLVRLRATSMSSETDLSECYRWVAAQRVACDPGAPWPSEGSFVMYQTFVQETTNGTTTRKWANVTLNREDGRWPSTCSWHIRTTDASGRVVDDQSNTVWSYHDPFVADRFVAPGDGALVAFPEMCPWTGLGAGDPVVDAIVGGETTVSTMREGTHVTVAAWDADDRPDTPTYTFDAEWAKSNGLLLRWRLDETSGGTTRTIRGALVDTDAPIG